MDVTSHCWFIQIFLLVYVVVGKRKPSSYSRFQGDGESCTFSDGQFCRDHLVGIDEVEQSDKWQLLRAELLTHEYYASISCRQQCEEELTVLRSLEGSKKSLYLSFYYNIWKVSNTSVNPPSLRIVSCGSKPNWVSNVALNDYRTSTWRGAVMSLYCENTFNISFVAELSSPDHVIAVDNIALTYGFSTRGILSQPSYNITSPLGGTDNPVATVKMAPNTHATSATPVSNTSATMKLFITDKSREDKVPFRTFAMSGTYGVNIDDHAAFTPVMIMTFIAIICTTTVTIHILIYKNQRRISSRLRRVSATILPSQREQRKSSPDIFVTSYSSSHVTEPRTVSFVSQNVLEFHLEEGTKPTTQEEVKRRVSVGCIESLPKPSPLRPHGRAYTTPAKPNDELYESIDGTSFNPGLESGPKRFLRKLSPSRLPRLLDSKRFSITDLHKKDRPEPNSSSALSVTVDSNVQKSDKLSSQRLTPPLPPRTYSAENGSHAKKCKSSPLLISKKTFTLPRVVENLSKNDSRRWSEVTSKYNNEQIEGSISKRECEYHVLENGSPQSIKGSEGLAVEHLKQTDLKSPDHRYFILDGHSMEEPSQDLNDSVSLTVEDATARESDHGYHVLENSASLPLDESCTLKNFQCAEESSMTESNTYQSLRGSLASHHTYQSLDHQTNLDYAFDMEHTLDEMEYSQSCQTIIKANVISTENEGTIDNEKHTYSFPQKRKDTESDHQSDMGMDDNLSVRSKIAVSTVTESSAVDSNCSLSLSSDHSGYTQLQTQETNAPCSFDDNESSGGYDHIKR